MSKAFKSTTTIDRYNCEVGSCSIATVTRTLRVGFVPDAVLTVQTGSNEPTTLLEGDDVLRDLYTLLKAVYE